MTPLSEHEQRILEEIERDLYKEDPKFAKEVQRKAPRMQDRRRVRIGAVTFIAGFVLLFAFFVSGLILVGVAAFGVMVAGVITIAGSLLASLAPRRPPGPKIGDRFNSSARSIEDKLRRRYRRH